jgi:DNA polymerase-3 subunit epsilon|nr:MAG TPA: DNA polymerase III subunit alpha [Caudoviricetes sp.]
MNNLKNANFIAIDFETATASTRMPCQIGIAVVKEGEIVECIERYIQPPENRYSEKCIDVHGITPDMTKNKPEFDIVWEEIKSYFDANFIVAHNSSFDLDVLRKALDRYNLSFPVIMGSDCTYAITGGSLNDVCGSLNIELNHHDAMSDAKACAEIYLQYLNGKLIRVESEPRNKHIETENNGETKNKKRIQYREAIRSEYLKQNLDVEDENNSFYNKKVVVTGVFEKFSRNEMASILQSLGANVNTTISKYTNYVIVGRDPGPSKMVKIETLQDEGWGIQTITEDDFICKIEGYSR